MSAVLVVVGRFPFSTRKGLEMRQMVAVCLVLLSLVACTSSSGLEQYGIYGTVFSKPTSLLQQEAAFEERRKQQAATHSQDDAKCRELGFQPKTEAYGNCRLQLEQIRATQNAADAQRAAATAQSMDIGQPPRLSLLCKDALARRDQGGAFVHC
jgi:hypothetical protein